MRRRYDFEFDSGGYRAKGVNAGAALLLGIDDDFPAADLEPTQSAAIIELLVVLFIRLVAEDLMANNASGT